MCKSFCQPHSTYLTIESILLFFSAFIKQDKPKCAAHLYAAISDLLEWYNINRVDNTQKSDIINQKEGKKMSKYSKEFKEEALKLSDEIGVKKAALQLGLQYYTLADWRKARKYAKKHTVVLTENEANAKICELERENAELRLANEILKDALGFFAKDRNR